MGTRAGNTIQFPIEGGAQSSTARVLPISPGLPQRQKKLISDTDILQLSTALQASLHVKDVVHAFGNEVRRIVRDVNLRYGNEPRQILIEGGTTGLHRCNYELNLLGDSLGEIIFTRLRRFTEHDRELLEIMLCALIYPLRNALLYEQALTQALKDPLTGINNRASMDAYIKHQVLVTERHKTRLSLIMLDVDLFKSINDTFGHIVGDAVLRSVAQAIVRCTRDSDVVFRYGGEEFVVVLTNTDGQGAEFLAERIRQSIVDLDVEALADHTNITVSAGVAEFRDGDTVTSLLGRADEMLYTAKQLGRNRVKRSAG